MDSCLARAALTNLLFKKMATSQAFSDPSLFEFKNVFIQGIENGGKSR